MLSRTGEYALRAVLYLALKGSDKPVTADEMARALDVPRNYLSKTLHRLARSGVLKSTRGPHGGFRLAKPAVGLPISSVVSEFQHAVPFSRCLLGNRDCDPFNPCAAHEQWREWSGELTRMMERTTVADFVEGKEHAREGAGGGTGASDPAVGTGEGRESRAGGTPAGRTNEARNG